MAKQLKQNIIIGISAGLLSIVFLISTVYGIVKLISFVINRLGQINPNVLVALITVCGTALVSVISVLLAKHYEHKAEIRREQHSKKIELYEKFIGVWFDFLFADKLGKKPLSEKEMVEKIAPIIRQLIPWGSDEVIKAFSNFKDFSSKKENENKPGDLFLIFEKLLINIRKDLGHSCKKLNPGDLSRLYITDCENYEELKSK